MRAGDEGKKKKAGLVKKTCIPVIPLDVHVLGIAELPYHSQLLSRLRLGGGYEKLHEDTR